MIRNNLHSFFNNNSRYIVIALIGISFVASSWPAYSWYNKRKEQQAHKDFAESVEDYHKMAEAQQDQQAWQDLEKGLASRVEKHSKSVLAPYFLAYQADSLIAQNKKEEAVKVLDKILEKINSHSPLHYTYAIKRALVKLDTKQPALQDSGHKDLENLSQDKQNPFQDMALYYLGYTAYVIGDTVQAEKAWHQLATPAYKDSVWAELAATKIQGLA